MTTSPYIRPRVGRRTVAAIAVACVVFGLLVIRLRTRAAVSIPVDFAVSVGIVYGLASGGWFLASTHQPRWIRVVSRGLTVLAAALVMAMAQRWALEIPPEPQRYLLFLGGMAVVQTALAALVGLPRWGLVGVPRWGTPGRANRAGAERGAREAGEAGSGRQFRIGDLLVSTAALAGLFALGGHYSAPVEGKLFWTVLMACWFLLPVVATFAMACSLRRGWRAATVLGLLALVAAAVATGGLAGAEQAVERGGGPAPAELLTLYGGLIGAYGVVVFCIGAAGRFDARSGAACRHSV